MINKHNPKKAADMNRTELIYELARHIHQDRYHQAIFMPTWALQRLLESYRGETRSTIKLPRHEVVQIRGIPMGIILMDEASVFINKVAKAI